MKDGGPAFPRPHSTEEWGEYVAGDRPAQEGITKREFFAAMALTGRRPGDAVTDDPSDVAAWAFAVADALLEASGSVDEDEDAGGEAQ